MIFHYASMQYNIEMSTKNTIQVIVSMNACCVHYIEVANWSNDIIQHITPNLWVALLVLSIGIIWTWTK